MLHATVRRQIIRLLDTGISHDRNSGRCGIFGAHSGAEEGRGYALLSRSTQIFCSVSFVRFSYCYFNLVLYLTRNFGYYHDSAEFYAGMTLTNTILLLYTIICYVIRI